MSFDQAAFDADGEVIFHCFDRTVRVWSAAGAELPGRRFAADGFPYAFSPDGRFLAVKKDATLLLWDTKTGACKTIGEAPKAFIQRLAFSPDGRRLISTGGVPTNPTPVQVWDCEGGKEPTALFNGRSMVVRGMAFSPDGREAAFALAPQAPSRGDEITVCSVPGGEERLTLRGCRGEILCAAFRPDGKRLVTGAGDPMRTGVDSHGELKLWDATKPPDRPTLPDADLDSCCVCTCGDGRIAAGGKDGKVRVWDPSGARPVQRIDAGPGKVLRLAWSADGERLVSVSQNTDSSGWGTLRAWNVSKGAAAWTAADPVPTAGGMAFSPDGSRVAASTWDGAIRILDGANGRELRTLPPPPELAGIDAMPISVLAFYPDAKRLALIIARTGPDTLRVYDLTTGDRVLSAGKDSFVSALTVSSDGRRLAAGTSDGTLQVFDASDGRSLATMPGYNGVVRGAVFSPDGGRVATFDYLGTIRIWDADTGEEALTLRHLQVDGAAFTGDGRILASVGYGGLWLWDATPAAVAGSSEPRP